MTLFDLSPLQPETCEITRQIPPRTALEQGFPAAELSKIAHQESWRKEVHRPATSTHKWWAKRLGTVFRGILTAATIEHGADVMAAYAGAVRLSGLTVLDPFAGSGTTVVEAVKLGAHAIGWDINPVATLVQRQAVQRWDLHELERAYKLVQESCRNEINRIHRTEKGETVLYYFWVAVAACSTCGADVRLFSSHVFSQNAYPKRVPAAQIVCPDCLDIMPGRYDFATMTCRNGHRVHSLGAVTRSNMTCPQGHTSKIIDALGGTPPRYEMYAKLVLDAKGKKRYDPITDFDRTLYAECTNLLQRRISDLALPEGALEDGENTRQAIRWGFATWRQFFNDRQLYSLGLLAAAIRDLDAAPAEREALAALFSGMLEFNNMFCSFKGEGTGAVRHMFSHHILRPERAPLEAHPWGTPASSGSFSTLYQSRIMRAHEYKAQPIDLTLANEKVVRVGLRSEPVEKEIATSWLATGLTPDRVYLRTGDSSRTDLPDESVDLVITDPPYMDNVHYSELADFFHSWLREIRPYDGYLADRATTRSAKEVQSASPEEFEEAITRVWQECHRVLKPDGLLAFTFHQARLSGWAALVKALRSAHLTVTAVQPIKGEMTTSVTKGGIEPSNLDAIVVCRKLNASLTTVRNPATAANTAAEQLTALQTAGMDVGAGDIRSVVRGHVLSIYTDPSNKLDLASLATEADELAEQHIAALTKKANQSRP